MEEADIRRRKEEEEGREKISVSPVRFLKREIPPKTLYARARRLN